MAEFLRSDAHAPKSALRFGPRNPPFSPDDSEFPNALLVRRVQFFADFAKAIINPEDDNVEFADKSPENNCQNAADRRSNQHPKTGPEIHLESAEGEPQSTNRDADDASPVKDLDQSGCDQLIEIPEPSNESIHLRLLHALLRFVFAFWSEYPPRRLERSTF
jgi:hypothetical protein